MRHSHLILSTITILMLLYSCTHPTAPTPKTKNTYTERHERSNNKTDQREDTKLTLNGKDWFALKGRFHSATDRDNFFLRISPRVYQLTPKNRYRVQFRGTVNGQIVSGFLAAGFPVKAITYAARTPTPHILVGYLGIRLQKGDQYMVVQVYGLSTGRGNSLYEKNNRYTIYLK